VRRGTGIAADAIMPRYHFKLVDLIWVLTLLSWLLIWILTLLAALVRVVSHRSISTLVSSRMYSGVPLSSGVKGS
jgi:hypothetical protein